MMNQPAIGSLLRVLYLEDQEDLCELVAGILSHASIKAEITHAHNLATFEQALANQTFDVVLADMVVSGMVEWAALDLFQKHELEIPFIFVSGSVDEQTAIEGLKRGATDYVSKSRLTRLPFAINRGLIEAKHKAATRQAEKNRACLAAIVESTVDFVATADSLGRILYINAAGREMIGAESDEDLIGRLLSEFHPSAPGKALVEKALAEAAKSGQWRGETLLQSRGGRTLPVAQLILAHKQSDGTINYFSSICRDLSENKRLEANLLRAQRLEGLGTLAGGIAHDLNNVLTPILMCAKMLRTENEPAAIEEWAETIETNARRGADLVRQVLTFARGVEGDRGRLNLKAVLDELQKLMRETFPRSIMTRVETDEDLWPILANSTHIHQVLLNLCLNSRDAMPGGGTLNIVARNAMLDSGGNLPVNLRPGQYVFIRISDTGVGIPQKNLNRVFDPFFTTKSIGEGTGLGLSTASGIVRNYGGWIEVDSQINSGTTFTIYLPGLADAGVLAQEAPSLALDPISQGLGETVLLVDDEQDMRRVAKAILERHGYRVVPAANGLEGIALYNARRGEIKVILTDVSMPLMDGPEMVRRIRLDDPGIPIITMSGFKNAQQEGELSEQENLMFLAKPFAPEDLLRRLDRALSASRRAA